jgi:pimeloyl-ACP methyl ester carboxylesterase
MPYSPIASDPTVTALNISGGRLSVARAGTGPPVVLLHQTPRSWDEYRDVLPLLTAGGYAPVAFDTPGFGASDALDGEPTIERWAAAVHEGLDALGIERAAVVGHHTGGVIAVEVAAQRPQRVTALVLSSTPLTDAAYRAAPPDESGVDTGVEGDELRRSRADFYPRDRPDLLDRYVADALRAGPLARAGHHIVAAYDMDATLEALTMPVLLIGATEDAFAHPQLARFGHALNHAEIVEIAGGMVPLPDGWPAEFAGAVLGFLDRAG